MNILAIIPARKNSKGIINKNIKLIKKKPLITYTIDSALKSNLIEDIVVSSDSKKVKTIVLKSGIKNFSLRPFSLATDKSPVEKTIIYELKKIEKEKKKIYELIVLLQPTSPIRKNNVIDKSILYFKKNIKNFDSLISISRLEEPNPYKVYTLKNKLIKKLIYYRTKTDTPRRQDYPNVFIPNGIIYIYKRDNVMKNKKILGNKILGYKTNTQYINIDKYEDLIIAEKLL
jgi:CMP-N-acetylneuraminic acid synthetase